MSKQIIILGLSYFIAAIQGLNADLEEVNEWFGSNRTLGQLSAVAFDNSGNILVFQRGNRIWNADTFSVNEVYTRIQDGPIPNDTVLVFGTSDGILKQSWGGNFFYMPHGLTVDFEGYVWVTDVALHQVFKFAPDGQKILLTLGTKFMPGNDLKHFCKPTSVAVMETGDFFVADGYCNARIIKYSADGKMILLWGTKNYDGLPHVHKNHYSLAVPHALTLVKSYQEVCVADRENGRIMCYDSQNGTYTWSFSHPSIGSRLFSLSYNPVCGGQFYIVNGPVLNGNVSGFVISRRSNSVILKFGMNLKNPHDIAVSQDGSQVFVVELEPYLIHKYIKHVTHNQTEQLQDNDEQLHHNLLETWLVPSAIAFLVLTVCVVFTAIKIIKNRKGITKHWTKPGRMNKMFSLTKLNEKQNSNHGFQRLKTNESDEEIGTTIDI